MRMGDKAKKSKMASIPNNHELAVILTEEAGFEGNQELMLEQSSKQLDSDTDGPPQISGSCLTTNSSSEATMLALSPVRNLESDNAARSRSPVHHWKYYTINLHNAVRINDIGSIEQLLESISPPDCNQKDKHGYTPLHYAAKFNRCRIFELLLIKGKADPTIPTMKEQFTALHLAARCKVDLAGEDSSDEDVDYVDSPPSRSIVHYLVALPKVKVNAGDRYDVTALHMACQCGNLEGVNYLLSHSDIKIDAKDKNDDTPLHEACLHGDKKIVKQLLEKMKERRKTIDMRNKSGLTPLHLACREGYFQIVELLLDHYGGDCACLIMAKDNEGATPLHLACQNVNEKKVESIVRKLLSYEGTDVLAGDKDGITPAHIVAQYGHTSVMAVLLLRAKDALMCADNFKQTPMHYAAEYGRTEMLKSLHKKHHAPADVMDHHCYSPILTAAESGQAEAFSTLLKFRGPGILDSMDKDGKSALFLAAESNYLKIIKIILKSRLARKLCSVADSNLHTPLHIAAKNGHLEAVKLLIKHKIIKQYTKDCLSKTALHLAIENGHTGVARELLGYCSVKDTDQDGNTPLHLACIHGFVDIVELLVNHGADVEAVNTILWTPLGCAASSGHERVVQLLIDAKAIIDPKDKSRATPLHLASKEGHLSTVNILLKNQADVRSKDDHHFNALDWAIENGHEEVAKAFIENSQWKDALDNITITRSGRETTPFRELIKKMPDVAELILNKCTEPDWSSEGKPTVEPHPDRYTVNFNFELLEDLERNHNSNTNDEAVYSRKQTSHHWDYQGQQKTTDECVYVKGIRHFWGQKKLKHPLTVMVDSRRAQLLKHPLVNTLLDYRWNKYGRFLFYTMLTFHIAFVILLTSFSLLLSSPVSNTCTITYQNSTDDNINVSASNMSKVYHNSTTDTIVATMLSCDQRYSLLAFLQTAGILIIIISILRLALECYQFIQLAQDYFTDLSNWVEIPLFLCSIVFALVFDHECLCPRGWQWQIGILALFLAWVDLILFMRQVRLMDTGVYVLMFESIFKTFLKMIILTVLLVVTFALAFFMAFHQFDPLFQRSPFASPFRALIKTMTMTTGELDFESIFRYSSGGSAPDELVSEIPFPVISFILWIVFLVLMPILLANMLVGLAVDDIKGIQETATLTRLALRVNLVLSLEAKFACILRGSIPRNHKMQYGKNHRWLSWFKQILHGEDFSSAEHISSTLNPSKTPIEQQTLTLMREMHKMQETLDMLTKSVEELKLQH